jgi:hypothetical protein
MPTADLLSAASLLLTVLTILYSLWLPEITTAANSEIDQFQKNRKQTHRAGRRVFLGKALPLFIAALVLIATMTPPALEIVRRPLAHELNSYDAVATIFMAVIGVLLLLTAHTCVAACKLGWHVRKLNPRRGDYVR